MRRSTNAEKMELPLGDERLVVLSVPAPDAALRARLTPAEDAVVSGVLEGLSNAEIAERRRCSPRTVANQLQSVFRKLDVRGRAELAARLGGGAGG